MENADPLAQCPGDDWQTRRFQWPDYLVFIVTLLVSICIGIFYGFFVKKQNTAELLMGNRQMNFFTLGISLTVGFASAIAILGNAAEMYNYGTQFVMTLVGILMMVPATAFLCLPVFRELGITSIYEYLERRFGNKIRLFVTVVYMLQIMMYLAVVVYAPALALRQVTGIGTMYAVAIIFAVGIFYSAVGGIKAVVWSDVFQFLVLMSALAMLMIRGAMTDGAPSVIWSTAKQGQRLEFFNMDPDPRVRHSFWSTTIGASFYWIGMTTGQATLLRLLAVPTQRDAIKALCLSGLGMVIMYSCTFYLGLQAYAHFQSCDPLLSKSIDASDQLLPLYMMEVVGDLPGLPGLFVAGVFSASLSTLGSSLSAVSGSLLRDILGGAFNYKPSTEARSALITKLLTVAFGALSFALTFVVAQLGGVLQVAISFNGMVVGVILGIFVLGLYVPWSNTKGVLTGCLVALTIVLWLGMGAQVATISGRLVQPRLEVGLNCSCEVEVPELPPLDDVFDGYRISYLWYSPIGFIITIIVSLVASWAFGWNEMTKTLDASLLAPAIRKRFIQMRAKSAAEEMRRECKNQSENETTKSAEAFT